MSMTPREIVEELDKHIIGQHDAKRAVAIALRNRWRRSQVKEPLRSEITPKNILMIGPTGVGKTEIARRLAKLAHALGVDASVAFAGDVPDDRTLSCLYSGAALVVSALVFLLFLLPRGHAARSTTLFDGVTGRGSCRRRDSFARACWRV